MTVPSLNALRRRPLRRSITLIAAVAVLVAGLAQAAHFHKDEFSRGTETHLACLLCLHADRGAGPPSLPQAPKVSSSTWTPVTAAQVLTPSELSRADYDARGPPRA